MMTVAEMINELSKYESDRQVYFEMIEGNGIVPDIEVEYDNNIDKLIITI